VRGSSWPAPVPGTVVRHLSSSRRSAGRHGAAMGREPALTRGRWRARPILGDSCPRFFPSCTSSVTLTMRIAHSIAGVLAISSPSQCQDGRPTWVPIIEGRRHPETILVRSLDPRMRAPRQSQPTDPWRRTCGHVSAGARDRPHTHSYLAGRKLRRFGGYEAGEDKTTGGALE
jgi:hypothetical protein